MKSKVFISIFIGILILLLLPFLIWQISPQKNLDVLIIDKTVPDDSFREHKGIVWALKYNKYVKNNNKEYDLKTDYAGFVPEKENKYKIRSIEDGLNSDLDLIYMADTYGVYEDEFFKKEFEGQRSELIYGGFTISEIKNLKKAVYKNQIPLVAEFNSFATPTDKESRAELTNLLGIEWSGWIGRYFNELNPEKNKEIPSWMLENYKKQYGKPWDFENDGIVLVREDDYIVVLEEGIDFKGEGVSFNLTPDGESFFGSKISTSYNYWFDITTEKEAKTLASYSLNLTAKGENRLKEYNLPNVFPAVTKSDYFGMPIYYFAGDYADLQNLPKIYNYAGLDKITKFLASFQKEMGKNFYYRAYLPMMNKILSEAHAYNENESKLISDELNEDKVSINTRINQNSFEVYEDGTWEKMPIKGVNMGMGKPGSWPGEAAISFEEYYRWMKQIGEMGANTIRVYTIHPPEFYQALWLYNKNSSEPLYVLHGIWIDEGELEETLDAFNLKNIAKFENEMKNVVDVVHGNANIKKQIGHSFGEYTFDVSPYISGWILGIEWYPYMVENTNIKHKDIPEFEGEYIYTKDAEAFEKWLAARMEFIISYETKEYSKQRPVSFTNWPTTDLLSHPSEPLEKEDMVSVNPNYIYTKKNFKPGYFASYHVYPYYPDFLNIEDKYLNFVDHRGEKNNYAGYLKDLIGSHKMPVLIAEFGVPSSRGKTHENPFGWNQGGLSEEEQGKIGVRLYEDIMASNALGGVVFTWQDEWFKRTWNTMELDNPDRRPYWSNVQTNEQRFGLLSFETNKKSIDTNKDKWSKENLVDGKKDGTIKSLYADYDEAYLYLMFEYDKNIKDVDDLEFNILLDTIKNQGNKTISFINGVKLNEGADFVAKISSKPEKSRLLVDSYYDSFYYQYGYELKYLDNNKVINDNSGNFNPIYYALSKAMKVPSTGQELEFSYYETGKLKAGLTNENSSEYNSLADYNMDTKQGLVEIRIPWLLLSFKDPSQKEIMGDLWQQGLKSSQIIEDIGLSLVVSKDNYLVDSLPKSSQNDEIKMKAYSWKNWEIPNSKERLKKSYYIFKDFFTKQDSK